MSISDVTTGGLRGVRPGREAMTGVHVWPDRDKEQSQRADGAAMVLPARTTSYYGKPVLNPPAWEAPDIPGYLFLGGLAGASSVLAAGAQITRRPALAKAAKLAAAGAGMVSLGALVHDLGRPERFLNMLRVLKVTSPMSVGSWLLAGYVPAAGAAALTDVAGIFPRLGGMATVGAALVGPAVSAYTGALISDTAVPAWHDGYREMPYLFVGSGASAAGGFGLLAAPLAQSSPARRTAIVGAAAELAATFAMERRLGMVGEPYHQGKSGKLMRLGEVLTVAGALGAAVLGGRSRLGAAASGAALLGASALTRFGVFHAGKVSASDPRYVVEPQRRRLDAGRSTATA